MKNIAITTIILLCAVELMAANSAITPPSSGRGGAKMYRKDAGYRQGNNIITGNVTEGKGFKGFVPYRSSNDFHGPLGTKSMDNFVRDSSGTNTYRRGNVGKSSSYYSATSSVTSMKNRQVYGSRTTRDYKLNGIVKSPTMDSLGYSSRRSPRAISQVHSGAISNVLAKPITENTNATPKAFQRDLYNIAVDKKNKKSISEPEKDTVDAQRAKHENRDLEPLKPKEAQSPDSLNNDSQQRQIAKEYNDIFEQIKINETEQTNSNATDDNNTDNGVNTKNDDIISSALKVAKIDGVQSQSAQAASIRGKYKTFASYANDKFNTYMRQAQDYIKQGEYYKASNAFSLASVFRDEDPLPFAGRALALLGAGEYMNSSLYLQRAILIYNKFPQIDIDLAGMIGDKDILQSRIVEIKEWQKKSESAQLALLLSYIYLQTDHLDWAQNEIEKAENSDSSISAIRSIKEAIDKKRNLK